MRTYTSLREVGEAIESDQARWRFEEVLDEAHRRSAGEPDGLPPGHRGTAAVEADYIDMLTEPDVVLGYRGGEVHEVLAELEQAEQLESWARRAAEVDVETIPTPELRLQAGNAVSANVARRLGTAVANVLGGGA